MQGKTRRGKYKAKKKGTREKRRKSIHLSSKMVKNKWKKSERANSGRGRGERGEAGYLVSRCIHTMSMCDKRKRRESKTTSVEWKRKRAGEREEDGVKRKQKTRKISGGRVVKARGEIKHRQWERTLPLPVSQKVLRFLPFPSARAAGKGKGKRCGNIQREMN